MAQSIRAVDDARTSAKSIWWCNSLTSVFESYPDWRVKKCLEQIEIICEVLRTDTPWSALADGALAYQSARNWVRSGRWDMILVLLHQSGKTGAWPAASDRWGREPFNRAGYPKTGFFSIISLSQARHYLDMGGPAVFEPFPVRAAFRRADDWRLRVPIPIEKFPDRPTTANLNVNSSENV